MEPYYLTYVFLSFCISFVFNLLYQEKLKTIPMHIFGGQIKVCYGRCALANECILRDVQLLENMLIEGR